MPRSVSTLDSEVTPDPRVVRVPRAFASVHPLVQARLEIPRRHVGTLRRTKLLRQLRAARDRPVISIIAPPGYGKSSLLVQWAMEDPRPVAWLTADDSDNDPVELLTNLAAAIDRHVAVDAELFKAIASGSVSHRAAVGRLLATMSRPQERVRIALDDGQRITSRPCLDILAELIEHLPDGSQVAIASRAPMRLPMARWRAAGSVLAIDPGELAMDEHEASGLGRELGLRLRAETASRLSRETEGWPALLALAMLGARTSPDGSAAVSAGTRHLIDDYLRSEVLESRPTAEISFLTRTSILDEMPAALCDVLGDREDSADVLRRLAGSMLLMDDYGGVYRYHALLRDFLQRELEVREPDLVAALHRKAAAWYGENHAIERAVDHAFAARDRDLVAATVGSGFVEYHWSGHRATIRAWARRIGVEALEARPWLAVLAAWEEIAAGDTAAAVRFADIAERGGFEGRPPDGTASFEAGRAMLRAGMVRHGAEDALANAIRAVDLEGSLGSWRDFAYWQMAFARLTIGDIAGADAALADAVGAAGSSGDLAVLYCVLGHRALVAAELGDWEGAAAMIAESDAIDPVPTIEGYLSSVPSRVVRIRLMIHGGDIAGARRELARATALRPLLTSAAPSGAVQLLLALARAHVAIDDQPGARALLAQADEVIKDRPDLGVLPAEVEALRMTVATRAPGRGVGATGLTVAELRVLSFLPYYLSFKEIGQRLGVKETTIKSQALSIYLKLEAANRSDAVDLAVEAGLLERFWPVDVIRAPRQPSTTD